MASACFEQGVPWHSGNYRVWIHPKIAYVTWQEHTVKCTVQMSTQNTAQSFGQFGQMVECGFTLKRVREMTRTYSHSLNFLPTQFRYRYDVYRYRDVYRHEWNVNIFWITKISFDLSVFLCLICPAEFCSPRLVDTWRFPKRKKHAITWSTICLKEYVGLLHPNS